MPMPKCGNDAPARRWAFLPIRLVMGSGLMVHGWAKLTRGPAEFAKLLDWIGAPLPLATAWVTTLLELLGGLALLVGAFVAIVSIPLIISMLVAMFTVHLRNGFSAIHTIGLTQAGPQFGPPGYEVNLLYVSGLLALMAGGAGPLSVDGRRGRARRGT
jgi:putative oxidoreductase